jgi:hypothetical protein
MKQPANMHPLDARMAKNVLVKGLVLFILANLAFAACYPMQSLGKISAYNRLLPGRERLPYGEIPASAYNLNLFNLEAMFASHQIAHPAKPAGEYRIILIGDSSIWGFLLPVEQTLSTYLNHTLADLRTPDQRQVRVYNLGYPVMSVAKDLLLLSYAMQYQPDLIVWGVTLESLPYDKQLFPPLLENNGPAVQALFESYQIGANLDAKRLPTPSFWQRTLWGARRPLADLARLQLYGVLWAATGIDQDIPATYEPRMEDLPPDESFHNLAPPVLHPEDLFLEALTAGVRLAGDIPLVIFNEPTFISQGENSHIRYNFFYPRWAYDDYRSLMRALSEQNHWLYLDLWDIIPGSEFTNSAVHLSAAGSQQLALRLAEAIRAVVLGKEHSFGLPGGMNKNSEH